MGEYILCILFWAIFTLFLYGTGRAFGKEKKSDAYALTTGYLVYSFLIAAGGITIQFTGLPWKAFAGYTAAVWAGLIGYMIYKFRKSKESICFFDLKQHIQNNWIIYMILAVFAGMLFFYYKGFWLGNHLDDGYYVTKVATLPYTDTGYATNYAVGVANSGFDSYILNTWELEASVYVKLLGVKPTLYLRLFQSIFYYFLFLNVVKAFSEKMLQRLNVKSKPAAAQYPVVITLLFGMYYIFLSSTSILPLRDGFHFNTGMFLGVTLPKMLGIILLLFYYIDARKLSIKMVLGVGAISLVMISKTSVVLPIIVIVSLSFLVTWLFMNYGKKEKLFALLGAVTFLVIAWILPGSSSAQSTLYRDVTQSLHSPVVIISGIVFLAGFLLNEKIIKHINCVMIISAGLMLIPEINDIFELCSVYSFVAGRAWTTWIYTLIIMSSIYLYVIAIKYRINERIIKGAYLGLGLLLITGIVCGFDISGDTLIPGEPMQETDIKNCLQVIKQNKYFIPNSTVLLGEELEKLSEETEEQLYVVCPDWVITDNTTYNMAVLVRTFAPDIVSVSATERFPVNNGSALESYEQDIYRQFVANPNKVSAAAFEEEIKKTDVNCIVVPTGTCTAYLENMGYELYSPTADGSYDIWY